MSAQPEMSAATREILGKVRQMVPPMLEKFHKGASTAASERSLGKRI